MKTTIYSTLEVMIDDILYQTMKQVEVKTGDIMPDQAIQLQNLCENLENLMLDILTQNSDQPIYHTFEEERFYNREQLHDVYLDSDARLDGSTFNDWLRDATGKNGTLTEIPH